MEEIFCILSRKHKKFLHGYCFGWLWRSGLVVNITIWTTWKIFEALGSSSICLLRICKRQLAQCDLVSVGGEYGCWLGQYKNTKKICTKTGLLGTGGATQTNEFSEKFQTAFDTNPSFLENHVAFFPKCNINFWIENGPPPRLGTFPKIHRFWWCHPSLSVKYAKKTSGPIIPHSFLVMCISSVLVYIQGKRVLPLYHCGAVNNHFLVYGAIFGMVRHKWPTNNLLGDPRASLLITRE